MKFLLLISTLALFSCDKEPPYRCEEMKPENKVVGCKLGDWWNFDLKRCNSTEEKCLKDQNPKQFLNQDNYKFHRARYIFARVLLNLPDLDLMFFLRLNDRGFLSNRGLLFQVEKMCRNRNP